MRQLVGFVMVALAIFLAARAVKAAAAPENVEAMKRLYSGLGARMPSPSYRVLRPTPLGLSRPLLAMSG